MNRMHIAASILALCFFTEFWELNEEDQDQFLDQWCAVFEPDERQRVREEIHYTVLWQDESWPVRRRRALFA